MHFVLVWNAGRSWSLEVRVITFPSTEISISKIRRDTPQRNAGTLADGHAKTIRPRARLGAMTSTTELWPEGSRCCAISSLPPRWHFKSVATGILKNYETTASTSQHGRARRNETAARKKRRKKLMESRTRMAQRTLSALPLSGVPIRYIDVVASHTMRTPP